MARVISELIDDADRSPGHETCHHEQYGLGCAEFELMLARSGGHCEFCHIAAEDTARGILCIDHDGRYGFATPRALVCDGCNSHFRYVDAGQRACGAAEREYYQRAWFMVRSWHIDGSHPVRVRRHLDFSVWVRFRRTVGSEWAAREVLTNYMRWHLRDPRGARPLRVREAS